MTRKSQAYLCHQNRPHPLRLIHRRQLRRKPLMKRQRCRLTTRIIHHLGRRNIPGHTRDRNNTTMVGSNHGRQELLREVVVAEGIDVEGEGDVALGAVKDRLAARAAGVVDQDGRVAEVGLYGRAGGVDGGLGGEVDVEVADGGGGWADVSINFTIIPWHLSI